MPKARRRPARRSPIDPHDAILLVRAARPLHLRVDQLPASLMGGARPGWVPRWVRLYLFVQFGQQLHRYVGLASNLRVVVARLTTANSGFIPAPSSVGSGGENLPALRVGRGGGAVHGADVWAVGLSMGEKPAGVHLAGVLRDSVCLLFLRGEDPEVLEVCVCGGG